MQFRMIWTSRLVNLLSVCCAVFLAAGCSGDGTEPLKNLVPVSGTITYDGEPLDQGVVSFAPVEPGGQSATGKIVDGKFTMQTTVSAPGVVAGKYKVLVESTETLDSAPSTNPTDLYAKPKNLIPARYNDVKTSGLEIEVVSGMSPPSWNLEP